MKFYLDGELVRTSKSHVYTCALVGESGSVISCHATVDQALKAKSRILAQIHQNRENAKAAIQAIDAGRTNYWVKYGRESWKATISNPREYYEELVACLSAPSEYPIIRQLEVR